MATDPGTAYTNAFNAARDREASGRKEVMDMLSWRQAGEMRAQQMRLQKADQEAQEWQRFYKEMGDFANSLKAVDPAQRELFIKSRMRANGIDPKAPTAQDTLKFIKSADDATLNNLSRGVMGIAANAPSPEAGKQLVDGVMSGRVTPQDAEKQGAQWREQKARDRRWSGQPSVSDIIPLPGGMQTGRVASPAVSASGGASPSAPTPQSTAEMVPSGATRSPTGGAVNAFAPQAAGGMKGTVGAELGLPGGALPGAEPMNPLAAATQATKNMGSVRAPQPTTTLAPSAEPTMGALMTGIGQRESGGRDNAKAPTSSATGRYQYTDSTWLSSVKKYKPDWAEGLTKDQILAVRANPQAQNDIMERDLYSNAALLEKSGHPASGGNLYAMHHLGLGGAGMVLRAEASNPDTPLTDILPKSVIKANPYFKQHTAGSLLNSFRKQFGDEPLVPGSNDMGMVAASMADQPALAQPQRVSDQSDSARGIATPEQPKLKTSDDLERIAQESAAVGEKDESKRAQELIEPAKAREGGVRTQAGVAGDIRRLKSAILDTSQEDWEQHTGSVARDVSNTPWWDLGNVGTALSKTAEDIKSRTGFDTGRSGQAVRAPLRAAANSLIEKNRSLMKAQGVTDSDFSNADRQFMDMVSPIMEGMTQEEAVKYVDDTIVPYWQDKFGMDFGSTKAAAPKENTAATLKAAKEAIATGPREQSAVESPAAAISAIQEQLKALQEQLQSIMGTL